MTRFDVLGPTRPHCKSIHASGAADFSLAGPYLSSQHWMLQAAGIGTDGATGALRVAGLGLAYASVFKVWLEDDDPGLAKTMAALDRRLRRGERTLAGIEQMHTAVSRFGEALRSSPATPLAAAPSPVRAPAPTPDKCRMADFRCLRWLRLPLRRRHCLRAGGASSTPRRGEDGASAVWTGHRQLTPRSTAGPSRSAEDAL